MAIFMCFILIDLLIYSYHLEMFSIQRKYINKSVNIKYMKITNVMVSSASFLMRSRYLQFCMLTSQYPDLG